MRIFITGISGLLGLNAAIQLKDRHEVSGAYLSHPVFVKGIDIFTLNLVEEKPLQKAMALIQPQLILHTAGLANVDACEKDVEQAELLHVQASEYVARAALTVGAAMVHISTDHLSDGTQPLVLEDVSPNPLNVYARTKWLSEEVVRRTFKEALIIRTNFFGWSTSVKTSFSDWILAGLKEGNNLSLFKDVHFTPILINDLVTFIEELVRRGAKGTYNVASSERVSKYDFGVQLAKTFGFSTKQLRPTSVQDAALSAQRPLDMSLSTNKVTSLLGRPMPRVSDSLENYKKLGEEGWPESLRQAMSQGLPTN